MPKLTTETAVLRIIDAHEYKEGALFTRIRAQCIKWGIKPEDIESSVQQMTDVGVIEEPIVGYLKRKVSI